MEEDCFILCACYSTEHQAFFWHDTSGNPPELYVHFHLITHRGFFKRLWYGLKYAFGYKCRFGAWDEFLFNEENENKLYNYLKERHVKEEEEEKR